MKVYTFSEARQQFSAVLDCAQTEGEVRVARRDGRVITIQPVEAKVSPLAVPSTSSPGKVWATKIDPSGPWMIPSPKWPSRAMVKVTLPLPCLQRR